MSLVPQVDFDFTAGDLIKIVVLVVGWVVTIVKIDGRLKNVEKEIKDVTALTRWKERIEERIITQRRDIDDLRRGRGFIRNGGVNGEYTKDGKLDDR
jgi:hypothetical protein